MRYRLELSLLAAVCFAPPVLVAQSGPSEVLARQVFAAESSFAATFAKRDIAAFAALVSPEAVFFGRTMMRGKDEVVEGWKGLFEAPTPPFSWKPDVIEVLESGMLAISVGPVYSPDGKHVSNFNSVWRREADGRWLVVFDKGSPVDRDPAE